MQHAFLKGESIWNVKVKQDDPWTWRKMLKIRSAMHEHTEVIIGDGRHTMLFFDNWLRIGNLAKYMNSDVKVWGESMKVCC